MKNPLYQFKYNGGLGNYVANRRAEASMLRQQAKQLILRAEEIESESYKLETDLLEQSEPNTQGA